jgi:3-hydroxyacyl-[acyl-carrier-protein] dehydratase
MLMLDRALVNEADGTAEGVKAVSMNEAHFQGHFPSGPIMPGVLQVAAIAQLGGTIVKTRAPHTRDHYTTVVGLQRIKFRKPVFPGDLLMIEAEVKEETDGRILIAGKTLVDGEVTCQGTVVLEMRSSAELSPVEDTLKYELPKLDGVELDAQTPINTVGIEKIIPHRYPFLLIDRVLHLDNDNMRIVALKNVTGNETFFSGLQTPAVPLPMLAEMAAQAGCYLALTCPEHEGKLGYFMSIDSAELAAPPVPGDQLVIDSVVSGKGRFGKVDSKLYVGPHTVAELAIKFAVVDNEN